MKLQPAWFKEAFQNARGFTLIEILVGMAITSIIMVGLTMSMFQLLTLGSSSAGKEKAIRSLDTAGLWLVRDFESAVATEIPGGETNLTPSSNSLTFIQSTEAPADTTVVYSVDAGGNLLRQVTVNSNPTKTSTVASDISSLEFSGGTGSSTNNIIITSTAGTGMATRSFSVAARIAGANLSILTGSLASATASTAYNQSLSASGGTVPYSWSLFSGSLPFGLTLNASTGVISGTPTTAGTSNFTVRVTDTASPTPHSETKSLSIQVASHVCITTANLSEAETDLSYSQNLAASGGTTPYNWSLDSGSGPLPAGISISSDGVISGIPTVNGNFSVVVIVTDHSGMTDSKTLSINVLTKPAITTDSLPNGTAGSSYNQSLAVAGGKTPYSWTIISGALPHNLILNSATGAISGTPDTSGTVNFTVKNTDAYGGYGTKDLSIGINGILTINTATLANGESGLSYSQTLSASGGVTPYAWSLSSGSLPSGLTLNASTGLISGTPSASETSNFTVRVTDNTSPTHGSVTKSLSITINTAITITTSSLPDGRSSTTYSQTMAASGGVTPLAWSIVSGSLPSGLTINNSTGLISGTPTASGTSSFTVRAVDNLNATATKSLSIKVVTSPGVTTNAATNLLMNSATLNGNLSSLGSSSTVYVYFQYGKNTNYGTNTTQSAKVFTGNFSCSISGLSKNTTYHFRAVASETG